MLFWRGENFSLERLPAGRSRVIYPPEPLPGIEDPEGAIRNALLHPMDADPLPTLLKPGMKLTICFDDASLSLPKMRRPDTRQRIIEAVLELAAEAGVDGLIIVDLPPQEAGELEGPAREAGLHMIYLLAPTSTEDRIRLVAEHGSGFVYCVGVVGITGARAVLSDELPEYIARVRELTDLPLAVGFGISSREHVRTVGAYADAAVVGSAFVQLVGETPKEERAARVRTYLEEITGRDPG